MFNPFDNPTQIETWPLADSQTEADEQLQLENQKRINRRSFLKLLVKSSLIGAAIGSPLGFLFRNWVDNNHALIEEKITELNMSPEMRQQLSEVITFRRSLGLEGLPLEIKEGMLRKDVWDQPPEKYVNSVPEKNISYSMRVFEIISKLFGDNATRNIKGCKIDQQYPFGLSFDLNTRCCNIADSIHEISLTDFTDYVLHEAIGHGSDPAVGAIYPPEILAQVEHGKWQALSQAFSVPEQFFNHPGDAMLPLLKKSIGETVGRFMTGDKKVDIINPDNIDVLYTRLAKVAQKKGKDISNLKYNKATCKEVGDAIITLQRKGRISLTGDLKKTYQDTMEEACIEIYAEMFKYALIYPDKIQNNREIMGGIIEIISAIGGKSALTGLRVTLQNPHPEIQDRHTAEVNMLTPVVTAPVDPSETEPIRVLTPSPTLSPEDLQTAVDQQKNFEKLQLAFQNFANFGTIPPTLVLSENQTQAVQKFGRLYARVLTRYPVLKDTFAQQYNEEFDPEMHIWEIHEIEAAMDSGFVRDLTSSANISDQTLENINQRAAVLEKFVNSTNFPNAKS